MYEQLLGIGGLTSIGLASYHHIVYPAAMSVLGTKSEPDTVVPLAGQELPEIAIVMPAFNEAAHIGEKILSIAASDYPMDRLTVIIGLDGCTDDTRAQAVRAAARYPDLTIHLVDYRVNRGKTAVLNALMRYVATPITVFSDVSAILAPDALSKIAAHFQDPRVGAVGGGYALPQDASRGQRAYAKFQASIKRGESRFAGLIGAHGALYAIRTSLFNPLKPGAINDDFIIPMEIAIAGWKTLYDPSIAVREADIVSDRQDGSRRQRIGAGNLQQGLWLFGACCRSGQPRLIAAFLSGKILRVAMGPLLLLGLACLVGLALKGDPLAAAAILFGIAGTGHTIPRYALIGHFQSMVGAARYLCGGFRQWRRVSADAEPIHP